MKTRAERAAEYLSTATAWGECLLAADGGTIRGYRKVSVEGRDYLLHRLIKEESMGRLLLPTETVDHACHNADPACPGGPGCLHRRCINADHLALATAAENLRRARIWERGKVQPQRDFCARGHPMVTDNINFDGTRHCATCARARQSGRDPAEEPYRPVRRRHSSS